MFSTFPLGQRPTAQHIYVPIHDKTLQYLGGKEVKYRVVVQARDKIHNFPVLRGGDEKGPQVHDL
jgi:hypothetical protein